MGCWVMVIQILRPLVAPVTLGNGVGPATGGHVAAIEVGTPPPLPPVVEKPKPQMIQQERYAER